MTSIAGKRRHKTSLGSLVVKGWLENELLSYHAAPFKYWLYLVQSLVTDIYLRKHHTVLVLGRNISH